MDANESAEQMNSRRMRAEYKRRRTVAIKKLREAGMSEAEIQDALAQLRNELGISAETAKGFDTVENLPAVIDSAGRQGSREYLEREYSEKPGRTKRNTSTIKENVARYDSILEQNPERRCAGTNSEGQRCRNFAIKGGRVCKFHGGATRHVKEKARIRVEMASDRLMGKLIDIAQDDTRPSSVQVDAIKDLLNRAGLSKPAQVEVGPMAPHEEIFDDIVGGSREAYRQGLDTDSVEGLDDSPSYESASFPTEHPTRPTATPASEPVRVRPRYDDRPDSDRYRVTSPITGDDAIRLANQANGFVREDDDYSIVDVLDAHLPPRRALPPGQSTW